MKMKWVVPRKREFNKTPSYMSVHKLFLKRNLQNNHCIGHSLMNQFKAQNSSTRKQDNKLKKL